MARGRMLNKKVCGSVKFQNLPDDTCRLLATWMIANLDVQGVFYGDPAMVRSAIFPRRSDITVDQIECYLKAIEDTGLMWRFEAKGDIWQFWPGFLAEQPGLRTDRETPDFPTPPTNKPDDAGKMPGNIPENSCENPAEEKLSEVNVSEEKWHGAKTAPTLFSDWLKALNDPTILDCKTDTAVLVLLGQALYADFPEDKSVFGRVGKLKTKAGSAATLAKIFWENATRGLAVPLDYLTKIVNNPQRDNSDQSRQPKLAKVAIADDPDNFFKA